MSKRLPKSRTDENEDLGDLQERSPPNYEKKRKNESLSRRRMSRGDPTKPDTVFDALRDPTQLAQILSHPPSSSRMVQSGNQSRPSANSSSPILTSQKPPRLEKYNSENLQIRAPPKRRRGSRDESNSGSREERIGSGRRSSLEPGHRRRTSRSGHTRVRSRAGDLSLSGNTAAERRMSRHHRRRSSAGVSQNLSSRLSQLTSSRRRTSIQHGSSGTEEGSSTSTENKTSDIYRSRYHLPLTDTSIVLDFGSRFSKIGFACDSCPRSFVSTDIFTVFPRVSQPQPNQNFRHQQEISPESIYLTQTPLSEKSWQTSLEQYFTNLLFNNLQVKVHERKMFICEDPFWPQFIREAIKNALFKIGIPSICFINSLTCPVFCTGEDTTLVVDIGYTTTKIQGLVSGHVCIESVNCVPLGMNSMVQFFKKCMNVSTQGHLDCDALKIKERAIEQCIARISYFTTKDADSSVRIRDVPYEFPSDGGKVYVHIPGKVRHQTCEAIFGENEFDLNLAEFIADTILKCPIDVRLRFISNILLSGGVVHIPGLEIRLAKELIELIETNPKYKSLQGLLPNLKFKKVPFLPNSLIWIGACIFIGLKPPQDSFIQAPTPEIDSVYE